MAHGARPLRSTRRLQNYASGLPKWYKVVKNTAGPTQISIYDEIGFYGVPAAAFLDELHQVPGDIEMHLHSPGGDIYEGLAIYNGLLQARKRGNVSIVIDGLAASAASFIAMAASPGQLEISPHARMMIHDGFCMAIGNSADMRELADQLDAESDNIAGIYADRTGKPAAYWRGKMQAETWYTDEQAVAEGLADRIHGQAASAADEWDLSVFANYAGAVVLNSARNAAPAESADDAGDDGKVDCPTCSGEGTIMDGHRQCPDCEGKGKVTPEQAAKLKATLSQPVINEGAGTSTGNFMLPSVLNADVDNSPWDASKAWAAGAAADDPAAFYKGICAGRKAGDPDTQDAWALPYKYAPSSPPNAAAVRNALARIGSTQGLTNTAEAKATLEKAMKAVNPDYAPDDQIDAELLCAAFALGLEGAR